jgi:exodeoxyribonuclease-3
MTMKVATYNVNGVIDASRHLHPREKVYTFWVDHEAFRRNAGFRMDFLLVNPALAPRLKATGVDSEFRGREKASDHAPTWAELIWNMQG